jgi:hypothetical protein
VAVDKKTRTVICVSFTNGKRHDFKLYKESRTYVNPKTAIITDTGYQGITKLHANSTLPHKRQKKQKLTKEQKQYNRKVSSERVFNEHEIGFLKRFKIIAERYRNRRNRFGLRFSLICGLCNFDMLA